MKHFIKTFLVGGLGGVVFLLAIVPLAYKYNLLGSARVIDQVIPSRTEIRKIEKEVVTFVSEGGQAEEAVKKSQESIVVIKSFNSGAVLRFGTGIVLTRDGLIVTVSQVVPVEAQDYQVFSGDKILKAQVVYRNAKKNLAILKVADESLVPATFNEEELAVGNIAWIVGRIVPLQKPELFLNRALVSLVDSQKKRIVLDGRYENYLSGAGLVSKNGLFKGIVYVDGGKIIALPSSFVKEFVDGYLK
ncbi:MAG: trypsin-like peptidase domain-containing protein [Candidatus Yanofskybacteria bacterium]|nr:trypsin-like peptidase domain-containing protein [Candidatus Yanofskybacteria bacterium]